MSFSFLNPWFWLGALAIAAPVWLHLRRRQEKNILQFSALRFLEDLPAPRRSPRRLQRLLLFALRVVALLLIVAAFAWPYRNDLLPNPVQESRVYVLDNTLSHQASGGFTRDRDRIVAEIERLGADFQFAVIELVSSPRTIVNFGEERVAAKRKLSQLSASHQRGSYLAAFREANLLLRNSLGTRKRVIFLSDNQENQWTENLNAPPFLHGIELELPTTTRDQAANLSLGEPKLQRVFLGDQTVVNLSVKLMHLGDAKKCNVKLRSGPQVLVDREVELEGQPETIVLQTQWEADPARWLQGEITVTGSPDELAGDNRAFFSLPPVTEGQVALLAQSPYLRLALAPEVMRGRWITRLLEPSQLAAELDTQRDADVLCLESQYLQSSDARKLVRRYLTNGRGVVLAVNRVTPVVVGALRELGFETRTESKDSLSGDQPFRFFAGHHPIFHPFVSPDFGNLTEVRVRNTARLKAVPGVPLIFSEAGEAVFFEGTKFPGRLFVSAFGFDREQTSWPTHVTFIPFLDLCLRNARADESMPTDYEPGRVAVINLAPDSPVREVILRDGNTELRRASVADGRAQLILPDQPGVYAVTYDNATEPIQMVAVNPSPKESQLRYTKSPEAAAAWRLNAKDALESKTKSSPNSPTITSILSQDFWWWLLLIGLAALALETIWTALIRNTASAAGLHSSRSTDRNAAFANTSKEFYEASLSRR